MDINKNILDWLIILETKPKMIITAKDIDYTCLKLYIEGFIDGIDQLLGLNNDKVSVKRQITYWFQEKIDQKSNVLFTLHIQHYYKDKSDDELKQILIDVLREYFSLHPIVI